MSRACRIRFQRRGTTPGGPRCWIAGSAAEDRTPQDRTAEEARDPCRTGERKECAETGAMRETDCFSTTEEPSPDKTPGFPSSSWKARESSLFPPDRTEDCLSQERVRAECAESSRKVPGPALQEFPVKASAPSGSTPEEYRFFPPRTAHSETPASRWR